MDSLNYLFAVEAEQLLFAGMPQEAIDLCLRGIEKYPNYSAALSILIKAYKSLGQIDTAREFLLNSKNNFTATTVKYLLNNLNNPLDIEFDNQQGQISTVEDKPAENKSHNQEFINNFREIIAKRDFSSNIDLIPGLAKFDINVNHNTQNKSSVNISQIENLIEKQIQLGSIIHSISKSEGIEVEQNKKSEKSGKPITITDTIANILMMQGAYSEAKNAYDELLSKFPDKKEFYEKKIKEIESIMDSKGT